MHDLYNEGTVKAKDFVISHSFIKHLYSFGFIEIEKKSIKCLPSYKGYYESGLLLEFKKYHTFLKDNELLDPYWNFKEEDILTLMIIEANKENIVASGLTRNQISSFYFKNEDAKYLRNSVSLSKAILQILGLNTFPGDEKDNQYIICAPTKNPRLILLCENIDKLRLPDKFRAANIELWYAGGKNIPKLANIRESERLPFWYVCDWDHDGLLIYRAIKRDYLPEIRLVIPDKWPTAKKPIGDHNSIWSELRNYDLTSFNTIEREIIVDLIQSNSWIEEEGFMFDLNLPHSEKFNKSYDS